ncbi:endogenous retrovirus group K member 6 Gag polyprotein [Microcebus murinus]|uniref:endogenous retrovirus group K member 6 Gag polyprotein n=1 Tax=Microcebus murinus TaxID=30608 RepID=UPI003F6DA368
MGQNQSKRSEYIPHLQTLLKNSGVYVKRQSFEELFYLIAKHCDRFPPPGPLEPRQWRLTVRALRRAHQQGERIPLSVWSLCSLISLALEPLLSNFESREGDAEDRREQELSRGEETLGQDIGPVTKNEDRCELLAEPLSEENDPSIAAASPRRGSMDRLEGNLRKEEFLLPPPFPGSHKLQPTAPLLADTNPFLAPPKAKIMVRRACTPLQEGIRRAQLEGDLEAYLFPVTLTDVPLDNQYPQGDVQYEHNPIPLKTLKELKQVCISYGANSPYTMRLIRALAETERLIPWGWKTLARAVLTSFEFMFFKEWWSHEAYLQAAQNAALIPPVLITEEQLTGGGAWLGRQAQLQYTDQAIVQVRLCCLKAWENLTPSFTEVKQGSHEPYEEFISRLEDLLTKTVSQPAFRELLLLTLAFNNANSECQRALRPLKARAASIGEYIKACQYIGSNAHKMQLLAEAITKGIGQKLCFNCGKLGHTKNVCHQTPKKMDFSNNQPICPSPGLCPRCEKGRHWAKQCRSKYHADGHLLP